MIYTFNQSLTELSRALEKSRGPDLTRRLVKEREETDPTVALRKQVYGMQADNIVARLDSGEVLSPAKERRLLWNLRVLDYRAENGPKMHYGYYDINLLPETLAACNPQRKRQSE